MKDPKYHIGDEVIYINYGYYGAMVVTIIKCIHQGNESWVYNGNISEEQIQKKLSNNKK
jgi:hypothetical protein